MDGIKAQQKVYKGYGIAAKKIGLVHTLYRSATAIDPIAPANIISTTFYGSFNISWQYMTASKYGNAVFNAVVDGNVCQIGDYLVDATGKTWFIADKQALVPILAVNCNAIAATIERPAQNTSKGNVGYTEYKPNQTNYAVLYQNIPLSILLDSRGEKNPVGLPLDTKWGRWMVLLPYLGNVDIQVSDVIRITENGTTELYLVDSNERTQLGWRLRCRRAVA